MLVSVVAFVFLAVLLIKYQRLSLRLIIGFAVALILVIWLSIQEIQRIDKHNKFLEYEYERKEHNYNQSEIYHGKGKLGKEEREEQIDSLSQLQKDSIPPK